MQCPLCNKEMVKGKTYDAFAFRCKVRVTLGSDYKHKYKASHYEVYRDGRITVIIGTNWFSFEPQTDYDNQALISMEGPEMSKNDFDSLIERYRKLSSFR